MRHMYLISYVIFKSRMYFGVFIWRDQRNASLFFCEKREFDKDALKSQGIEKKKNIETRLFTKDELVST